MSWYENKKLMNSITVVLIVLILSALLYFDRKEKQCQNTREKFTKDGRRSGLRKNTKEINTFGQTQGFLKQSQKQEGDARCSKNSKKPPTVMKKGLSKWPSKRVQNKQKTKYGTAKATKAASVSVVKNETIRLTIRAYCPCKKCCGKWWKYRTPTYKQRRLQPGDLIFATDGTFTPGTWLFVPGYGKCQVLDKGTVNEVFFFLPEDGRSIKQYYPASHQRAIDWGKPTLDVEILEEPK